MTWSKTPPIIGVFLVTVLNIFSGVSLTCHPAEYEVNNECCPMCPAGSRVKIDCTEFRSTSCLSCVEGTFTEKPNGLRRCSSCTTCDSGSGLKVRKSCTFTSDAVCEPLEGFWCIDPTKENSCAAAKKHQRCDLGQYISLKGTALTDTVCSNCSHGTFADGSTTTCQQHKKCEELNLQLIRAGTASADAECGKQNSSVIIVVILSVFIPLVGVGVVVVGYLKRNTIAKVSFGYCGNIVAYVMKEHIHQLSVFKFM
ncbi:unnamed protein product [Ophioblennius macclurei]